MAEEMRELPREECLRRLRAARIGRVAVTHRALPAIVPVNFIVDRGILFRTTVDGMLDRACRGQVVAFEVDDLAEDGSGGWSVLVVGVANALEGGEHLRAMSSGLVSARSIATERFIRITIVDVTGRELLPPLGAGADLRQHGAAV
jgi:nitroimidazol reductase NimA-like FMN-containing flavoprotein (pyridoxamine 5'-phosphate oxidase superfamily)